VVLLVELNCNIILPMGNDVIARCPQKIVHVFN